MKMPRDEGIFFFAAVFIFAFFHDDW